MPHGLATANRLAHTARAIRGASYPAPETLTAGAGLRVADIIALPHRAARPARDGAARFGGIAALDAQHRVSAAKVATTLGWPAGTPLIATTLSGAVTITAGRADTPFVVPVPLDADRRLTLPPTLTGALGVTAGEQVVLIAIPAAGELRLLAAADALQLITGPVENGAGDAGTEVAGLRPAGRTRVAPRWRPAPG
jgi:hypothetical protein